MTGARPGSLAEPGPQRSDRTARHSSREAHLTIGLPVLAWASDETVDSSALGWLTVRALNEQRWAENEEELRHLQKRAAFTAPLAQKKDEERTAWLAWWKRKKRKRRRKKLPKASSSRSIPASGARTQRSGHYSLRAFCLRLSCSESGCCLWSGVDWSDSGNRYMRQSSRQLWKRLPSLCAWWPEIAPRRAVLTGGWPDI